MRTITHLTYTRVAEDAAPSKLGERPHDAPVDAFLLDHLDKLRGKAGTQDAPVARFFDPDGQASFEQLRAGTDEDFYTAARTLAMRVIDAMDPRMAHGLLVCLRVEDEDGELSAAALKLEVVTQNAAILKDLESGEQVLSGVKDVLDAPGDLQKGAVVNDPRTGSDVVVGDRLAQDAVYFPRALGIRLEQRSADTAAELIAAIDQFAPQASQQAARALPTLPSGSTPDVLDSLAEAVPELDADVRESVTRTLEDRNRPVRTINTTGSVRKIVKAGGITIQGSSKAMEAVDISDKSHDGNWTITIVVDEEPEATYKK